MGNGIKLSGGIVEKGTKSFKVKEGSIHFKGFELKFSG